MLQVLEHKVLLEVKVQLAVLDHKEQQVRVLKVLLVVKELPDQMVVKEQPVLVVKAQLVLKVQLAHRA